MKDCKNCPAYAKCTVTYRGSACAVLRGAYGIDDDPEIITNADHIRAMSDDIRAIMEERGIREEDIREVLDYAESTGQKLYVEGEERYLAKKKIGNFTCNVEYAVNGGEVEVLNLYSYVILLTGQEDCGKCALNAVCDGPDSLEESCSIMDESLIVMGYIKRNMPNDEAVSETN